MRSVNFWRVGYRVMSLGLWRVTLITITVGLLLLSNGWFLTPLALADRPPIQSYIDRTIANITDFTLDNGMRFIVLERHESPTVSFITYANVGGVDEPPGKTGIAHFLEHLAFKGTSKIGTTDYAAEQPLLDRLDELHREIERQQAAEISNTEGLTSNRATPGTPSDPDSTSDKLAALKAEFAEVEREANRYAIQNEFGQIVQRSGGVGLNATTSTDATRYFYSFPSNKLELWMSLESERFLDPVFREFYKEQQVILEERRLRTDNSPIGATIETFLATAFTTHPYRNPTIGTAADIAGLSRDEVQAFFQTYYVPNNLTVAIVGDVETANVRRLAKAYFGRYRAGATPPQVTQVEPEQTAERSVEVRMQTEPWYLEGYHRPALNHSDNAVYDAIASILSSGRTSRLYSSLIQDKQVALYAEGFNGFPGDRYPNLMLFYGLTAPGHDVDEVQAALHGEIERISSEPVSPMELDRAKTQARAALLRSLDSNSGMASSLVEYQAKTGDWHNLFEQIKAIDAVTAEDILRVARRTFTTENRTIARLLPLAS